MTILLIRHGISEANVENRMAGHTDTPLTPEGIDRLKQLKQTGVYPEVEGWYVSDLQRAVQTAEILYPENHSEFQITPELREIHFGNLENQFLDRLQASHYYTNFMENSLSSGGEQYKDFQKRIDKTLFAIFTDATQKQLDSLAIIAHYGVLRGILISLGLLPWKLFFHDPIPNGLGYKIKTLESGRPVHMESLTAQKSHLASVG